ncbi:MAG: hypothetical protein KGQ49_01185 [Verrucomicrobia bacterium]|nr:hypothetical protein [Verrucomicrobiota bacterium]
MQPLSQTYTGSTVLFVSPQLIPQLVRRIAFITSHATSIYVSRLKNRVIRLPN